MNNKKKETIDKINLSKDMADNGFITPAKKRRFEAMMARLREYGFTGHKYTILDMKKVRGKIRILKRGQSLVDQMEERLTSPKDNIEKANRLQKRAKRELHRQKWYNNRFTQSSMGFLYGFKPPQPSW